MTDDLRKFIADEQKRQTGTLMGPGIFEKLPREFWERYQKVIKKWRQVRSE